MTSPTETSFAPELLRGDTLALSRAITLVENGTPEGEALLKELAPRVGGALRLGLTGPPGVGKSTTVDALSGHLRQRGESIGIIAVDPSSPFSGGALLGDRVRMRHVADDSAIFMRSMATRGCPGGLSRATQDAADLLDASGRKFVLIETVGVGQSEIEVSRAADCVLVLLSPESGDGIQAMKSGILEIADIVVINKADRPGADKLEHEIRGAFELGLRSRREIPILLTEAFRGKGIPELVTAIETLISSRRTSGEFTERRRRNLQMRIRMLVDYTIQRNVWGPETEQRLSHAVDEVMAKRQTPYGAAEEIVKETVDRRSTAAGSER